MRTCRAFGSGTSRSTISKAALGLGIWATFMMSSLETEREWQNSAVTYDSEVGTHPCHTYTGVTIVRKKKATRKVVFVTPAGVASTAELDEIVMKVIGRVADKWTMCVLEVLNQNGTLRFTRIAQLVGSISQRMLTKTLRQMEQ